MNRTEKYKLGYLVVLFILAAIAGAFIIYFKGNLIAVVGVAFLFFVPGRIQGTYFKELFTGRRLLDQGHYQESIPHFERFILQVDKKPSLNTLIWLSWAIYTPKVKAMALNNIGVAYLELGEYETAEQYFGSAIDVDSIYPIPYYNLAIINEINGNHDLAKQFVETSKSLGYKQGALDKVINKSQSLLASCQGN